MACAVLPPYAKSADFAFDKDSGTPCRDLQSNYQCAIHEALREKGFRGWSAYECFGAGQKVSQIIYEGKDWRNNTESAKEMFDVFPIMQQLHEMLWYLHEALSIEAAKPIHRELRAYFERVIGIAWIEGRFLSPVAETFKQYVISHFSDKEEDQS